ncbi:hypothetical protein HMPREF0083_01585 [Aneurinibacillus aneurinilyticus ATCC 12856]|uniref:Uncharacterized protein n=1 Tax=Aneurinibacillus aneurinilyticus ATCC 12856 TaxID=649747 RepID=U1YHT8_ANEAE|nr:hypothetical protein HMPREF0083_01585 [Aneurinibacillus aneurinilyticus ATCC 12856]
MLLVMKWEMYRKSLLLAHSKPSGQPPCSTMSLVRKSRIMSMMSGICMKRKKKQIVSMVPEADCLKRERQHSLPQKVD